MKHLKLRYFSRYVLCYINIVCSGTADKIADWLYNEINLVKTRSRAPLTISINSYWFEFTENSLEGLTKCLDKLKESTDVFFVTQKQVIEWMKNPVKLADFKTDTAEGQQSNCNEFSCLLKKDNEDRYMNSCVSCPAVYPWLGNPNGDEK